MLAMDRYEMRRLDFIDLKDSMGRGAYRKISDKTGIDGSYLSRMAYPEGKAGKKNIGDDVAQVLDKHYPLWRKRELEDMGVPVTDETSSPPSYVPVDDRTANSHIVIEQYKDVRGAMGKGAYLLDIEGEVVDMRVTNQWVNANMPANTGAQNLKIITGLGDSMKPMYNSGDPLVVDTGIRSVDFDAVYFFRVGSEGYVKRLQKIGSQGLRVLSENPAYPEWIIGKDEDFEVFGRVLKVWEGKDL